jgi:hypothetical protein
VSKISPSPEFDPRNFQPVANHYTGYSAPTHIRRNIDIDIDIDTDI